MGEPKHAKGKDEPRELSPSQGEEQIQQAQPEDLVTFLDRCIGFVLLVGPWSYLTALAQDMLQDLLPVKIINMVVLAGIIFFLVAVGWLSKRIHRFRVARRKEEPERESIAPDNGQPNRLD